MNGGLFMNYCKKSVTKKLLTMCLIALLFVFSFVGATFIFSGGGAAVQPVYAAAPTQGYGVLVLKVNSSSFYIPRKGSVNTSGVDFNLAYNWKISIDGGSTWTDYNGKGNTDGISITGIPLTGGIGEIRIKEGDGVHTNGWLAAFGFRDGLGGNSQQATNKKTLVGVSFADAPGNNSFIPDGQLSADYYMQYMFNGCSNLTDVDFSIPALPQSVTSANRYLFGLFYGCTGLATLSNITIPALPQNVQSANDYLSYAFYNNAIISFQQSNFSIPAMPQSVQNADYYLEHMFENCTSLTSLQEFSIPALPEGVLSADWYLYQMFGRCTKLGDVAGLVIPALPSTTTSFSNYLAQMIYGSGTAGEGLFGTLSIEPGNKLAASRSVDSTFLNVLAKNLIVNVYRNSFYPSITSYTHRGNLTINNIDQPDSFLALKTDGLYYTQGSTIVSVTRDLIPQNTASVILGGGSYSYDNSTGVLTLKDVHFATSSNVGLIISSTGGIDRNAKIRIELDGNNTIHSVVGDNGIEYSYGIQHGTLGTLEIADEEGEHGKLNITVGKTTSYNIALSINGTLSIISGDISLTAKENGSGSQALGIMHNGATANSTMLRGKLSLSGKQAISSYSRTFDIAATNYKYGVSTTNSPVAATNTDNAFVNSATYKYVVIDIPENRTMHLQAGSSDASGGLFDAASGGTAFGRRATSVLGNGTDMTGGKWYWDYETSTLYLNNLTFETLASRAFDLSGVSGAKIVLVGTNSFTSAFSGASVTSGIYAGALTISGTGSLSAIGGSDAQISYGIETTGAFTISGGSISATGGDNAGTSSYGIYSNGKVTINGGEVTAIGGQGTWGTNAETAGFSLKGIDVNAGTVNAIGGDNSNYLSFGIRISSTSNFNGGTVNATGGSGPSTDNSYGLYLASRTEFKGSIVTARGGNATSITNGIRVSAQTLISGGTVTAISGSTGSTQRTFDSSPSVIAPKYMYNVNSSLYSPGITTTYTGTDSYITPYSWSSGQKYVSIDCAAILSNGSASRPNNSENSGIVSFTVNETPTNVFYAVASSEPPISQSTSWISLSGATIGTNTDLPITIGSGANNVYVTVVDSSGQKTTFQAGSVAAFIPPDSTPPTLEIDTISRTSATTASITLEVGETPAAAYYILSDSSTTPSHTTWDDWTALSLTSGENTKTLTVGATPSYVFVAAIDAAGNETIELAGQLSEARTIFLKSDGLYIGTDSSTALAYTVGASDSDTVWETGEKWRWESETNTLFLRDFNFETSAATALDLSGISSVGLVLSGTNSVASVSSGQTNTNGILAESLTISGTGSLSATAGNNATYSYGINMDEVSSITSGSIFAKGGDNASQYSAGLYAYRGITISGGSVTATGGDDGVYSHGIYLRSASTISGGTINATGGNGTSSYSCGINVSSTFTISGGSVTANGGDDADGSFGINYNASTSFITGGTIIATGGDDADENSYGMLIVTSLTISGGSVSVKGGNNAGNNSYGLSNANKTTIIGGTVTAIGGSGTTSHAFGSSGQIPAFGTNPIYSYKVNSLASDPETDLISSATTPYSWAITQLYVYIDCGVTGVVTQSAVTSNTRTVTLTLNEEVEKPTGWEGPATGTVFTKVVGINGSHSVNVTDSAGNISPFTYEITGLDNTSPTLDIDSTNRSSNSTASISLEVGETPAAAYYIFSESSTTPSHSTWEEWTTLSLTSGENTKTLTVPTNGGYVYVAVLDQWGNARVVNAGKISDTRTLYFDSSLGLLVGNSLSTSAYTVGKSSDAIFTGSETWHWDSQNRVLYLNNFNFVTTAKVAFDVSINASFSEGFSIVLIGSNSFESTYVGSGTETSYGIYGDWSLASDTANLKISGLGSLLAKAGRNVSESMGICILGGENSIGLVLESGTLSAIGETSAIAEVMDINLPAAYYYLVYSSQPQQHLTDIINYPFGGSDPFANEGYYYVKIVCATQSGFSVSGAADMSYITDDAFDSGTIAVSINYSNGASISTDAFSFYLTSSATFAGEISIPATFRASTNNSMYLWVKYGDFAAQSMGQIVVAKGTKYESVTISDTFLPETTIGDLLDATINSTYDDYTFASYAAAGNNNANASTYTFIGTKAVDDVDYLTYQMTVTLSVQQAAATAAPDYTALSSITATYGDTLGSITLPTGWTFDQATSTSVGSVSTPVTGITATFESSNANYLGISSQSVTIVVQAKTISVTADEQEVTYGDATPTLTYVAEGFVNDQGVELQTGTLATAYTSTSNVGRYAITAGDLSFGDNYTISYTGSNVIVGTKTISVTADEQEVIYGDATPALTYVASGLINNDTLSGLLSTTYIQFSDVGTYEITSTLANTNYTVIYNSAVITVTQKEIGLLWNTEENMVFNNSPKIVIAIATGMLNGDEVLVTVEGGTQIDVGSYTAVATALDNSNYKLPQEATFEFTISPPIVPDLPEWGELIDEGISVNGDHSHKKGTTETLATYVSNKSVELFSEVDENGKIMRNEDGSVRLLNGSSVKVDGIEAIHIIPTTDYDVFSGSTIVVLSDEYLNTLSVGRHTMRITFVDGTYADSEFIITISDVGCVGVSFGSILAVIILLFLLFALYLALKEKKGAKAAFEGAWDRTAVAGWHKIFLGSKGKMDEDKLLALLKKAQEENRNVKFDYLNSDEEGEDNSKNNYESLCVSVLGFSSSDGKQYCNVILTSGQTLLIGLRRMTNVSLGKKGSAKPSNSD
jgi:hypothetical protein